MNKIKIKKNNTYLWRKKIQKDNSIFRKHDKIKKDLNKEKNNENIN